MSVNIVPARPQTLAGDPHLEHGEPLWKRVPKRDSVGRPYCDFMMLAPGLNKRPREEIEMALAVVRGVLEGFCDRVVFADFNLNMNVLWVSYEYRPGLMTQMVAVLRARMPMLRLVAHNPEA